MALDATPGGLASNSYLTVADANAIATELGVGEDGTAWLAASSPDKERALLRATTEIDSYVGGVGLRWEPLQALLFPRASDLDFMDAAYIVRDVELATYWQAVHVLRNADVIDRANARRAKGMISFSDDDGSGSMMSVKPEFGLMSAQALAHLRKLRTGRASLRSVPITSSYR